jgi:hypothetical protein
MIAAMPRATALLAAVAVAAALAACGGSSPVIPGIGPSTGNGTPTPAPVPTPAPSPTPTPTPTPAATPQPQPQPSPTAAPACGDLFMKIIRPDAGATVKNDPQAFEANVGHSVVRVDFYYHIDAFPSGPSAQAVQAPPVLIGTRNGPPWRVNWKIPDGCGYTVSLLAVGFDACGGGKDSGLVTVTTCKS